MTPTERLLLLADKLEQNANNPTGMKFDLENWFNTETFEEKPEINCGTIGCAVGLATLIPEFNAEGFIYSGTGYFPTYTQTDNLLCANYRYDGWLAVRKYFALDFEQATQLFDPEYYPIAKGAEAELMVAAKIRSFVKTGEVL